MFKRYQRQLFGGAAAIVCSAALASAQTPTTGAAPQVPPPSATTPTQSRPSTPQASRTDHANHQTIVGCLMREKDIPGRSPNAAERAGVLEDYILVYTNAAASSGAPGAVGTSGSTAPAPSGNATTNLGPLYKIEGISDDTLKSMIGKRVEVMGVLDKDDAARMAGKSDAGGATAQRDGSAVGSGSATQTGTTANEGRGDEKDDWMEFKAASMREVSGACPAAPANR